MEKYENMAAVIAENLIYYRKMANLTQQELASKISYSDKSISKWERGESIPDILVLSKLASLYKLSLNDFVSKNKKQKIGNAYVSKILISFLAVTLAFIVATIAFFILSFFFEGKIGSFKPWLCYIYAIPVSAIIMIVFDDVFFKRFYNIIFSSLLCWSIALSIFLSFLNITKIYMVFILAIPVQVFLALFYLLILKHQKE